MDAKLWLKWPLVAAYVICLFVPGYVFFSLRPGLPIQPATIYPLLGLYAFTLVSLQLVIGSHMRRLRPIFPGIMKFHRYQGLFAFLLACLHPLFITLTFGLYDTYVTHNITSPALQNYVWFGIIALTLMTITVLTAVGAWLFNRFKTVWRTIHVLNYIVFAAAWIHSWFIGSDVQTTVLKWFWLAYLAAWLVSVVMRIQRDRQIRVANAGQSIISESGGTNETN